MAEHRQATDPAETGTQPELLKGLGLFDATMIVVGTAPFMGDMVLRSVVTRLRGPAAGPGNSAS